MHFFSGEWVNNDGTNVISISQSDIDIHVPISINGTLVLENSETETTITTTNTDVSTAPIRISGTMLLSPLFVCLFF